MLTLVDYAKIVEDKLEEIFPERKEDALAVGEIPPLLYDAMRYSLLAGGKRVRASMLLAAVDMLGGDREQALIPACAVEMIHASSLIHDDLPGMDNDTMRRGRPTNHIVFGEGQAILAGDGLLNFAFECMLNNALAYPQNLAAHVWAIHEIARGSGVKGMMAGQCVDLGCEKQPLLENRAAALDFIHENKTSAMFVYPLRAAGRLCCADEQSIAAFSEYGRAFGNLFQVVDDLLDVLGDESAIGKSVGKDAASGKLTAVSIYGIEGAKAFAEKLRADAEAALSYFKEDAMFFYSLLEDMAKRKA